MIRLIKNSFIGICGGALLAGIFAWTVQADIYLYKDKDGVSHFTNVPTSSKYRLFMRTGYPKTRKFYSTSKYDHHISEASALYGVSFHLLKALIKAESDFNPQAVSKKGAMGLMQLMPKNVKSFKIKDPYNPRENIMGGTFYLKKMLNRFNGKVPLALAAYNAGPDVVDQHQSIPPIQETKDYVQRVLRFYKVFNQG
ncbi:MAG: transglycosylase SLT domain-containing protein [Desulfobacterales bacterium]|nr:transglycosylase SLT domain-containing protein [Desulfobacterales bacterium]